MWETAAKQELPGQAEGVLPAPYFPSPTFSIMKWRDLLLSLGREKGPCDRLRESRARVLLSKPKAPTAPWIRLLWTLRAALCGRSLQGKTTVSVSLTPSLVGVCVMGACGVGGPGQEWT